MKKKYFLLFILSLLLIASCRVDEPDNILTAEKDNEFDAGSSIVFPALDNQSIADLGLLCKIWGFLKYHHPAVGKGNYNWDYELFRFLPKYLQVKNTAERDRLILDWIDKYGKIPVCTTCRETPSDAFIKPDLLWAENSNMNNALKEKIREIYQNRHQGDHYYIRIGVDAEIPEFLNEVPKMTYNLYYPDAGFRLLTLFKYWNMIRYFYPNKYMTDRNWDALLPEYVPLFILANSRLEYEMATFQLIGEINDTHAASISGGVEIQKIKGSYYAPFRVWFIEGKLVVTDIYNPELMSASDIKIGDVITEIDGETVESIIENRKKYYPASNEASLLRNISLDLLRSASNTISIQSVQGGQKTIQLYQRSALNIYNTYKVDWNEKCYRYLDDSICYVTLSSITVEDIPEIQKAFNNSKAYIIDIRNYPNTSAIFSFLPYFVSTTTPYAKFSYGNSNNPGEFTFTPPYVIQRGSWTYQGKLIVIVNEISQSHAEFTAMALRAGINTTIIGSTTSGADGNVTYIDLPGGFRTTISGIGVFYPDGTETQRVGIVPDIWIEPTIEGIREGRDELLEKAISLINEEK